ncbi:triadin-like isoform X3 [Festucalex cinctus]
MISTQQRASSMSKPLSPPMSGQTSGGEAVPRRRANHKSILEQVTVTFSSPAAWLLVAALLLTWTAVAVVHLDLLDDRTLAGGVRPTGSGSVGVSASPPAAAVAGDWLDVMWTFAASLVAPDEEEEAEALHWEEL